jgi:hypothetical protein
MYECWQPSPTLIEVTIQSPHTTFRIQATLVHGVCFRTARIVDNHWPCVCHGAFCLLLMQHGVFCRFTTLVKYWQICRHALDEPHDCRIS